ncbi:MAG: hypothetical protein HKN36_12035 [Hellea sp.]|nr:hypothetical protein [Hellea sp.]
MADINLTPARFIMEAKHVSACFAAIGKIPPQSSFYAGLPAANEQPPSTMVDPSGSLVEELAAIFYILSAPANVIILRSFIPSLSGGLEIRLAGSQKDDNWVVISQSPDQVWDLALLTSHGQALVFISDLLELENLRAFEQSFLLDMTLDTVVALTLILEDFRLRKIQANALNLDLADIWLNPILPGALQTLANQTHVERSSYRLLMSQLSNGSTETANWSKSIDKGLKSLKKLDLLDAGRVLTLDGQSIVNAFMSAKLGLSLAALIKKGRKLKVDQCFFLRMSDTVLIGSWVLDKKGVAKTLRLTAMTSPQTLGFLEDILSS